MKLREKPLGLSKETIIANLTKDSIRELEKCRAQIKELQQRLEWAQTSNQIQEDKIDLLNRQVSDLHAVVSHQAWKLYQWEKSRS
jgi:hypothetical protein